jgi:outer membrane lipoprotein carrier protein
LAGWIFGVFFWGGGSPAFSAEELENTLAALQKKYSQVKDLRMDFIQNYRSPRRAPRSEAGILFLRRPGMMRWEYKTPAEKLFVSNGKIIYFYLPEDLQVQKASVKESQDMRIPFLFLLGKGNLKRDFARVEWARDEKNYFAGNRVLYAYPKRGVEGFARVLMEYNPVSLELQRITIYNLDGAQSEFVFTNIRENQGLKSALFDFKVPPGVQVVGLEENNTPTP